MNKLSGWRRSLAVFGVAILAVAVGAGVAIAAQDTSVSGNTDHTLYKFGRTVSISGTVNGDIFCAAQTVNIDATVNGDVICAGQTVTLNGTVNGDARLVGQTVNIGAKITRNLSLAGQDATLQTNASVGNDAGLAGQTINVDSVIGRDLKGAANNMTISSHIGRDANVNVNKLVLINQAAVAGNLDYSSPRTLYKDPGVKVAGHLTYHKTEARQHRHGPSVGLRLYFLAAKIVAGLVFVALFPQLFRRWNGVASGRFGASMLTGFLAMFAVPIVALAFMASVVGIPLGFFTIFVALAALFPSATLAMYWVGNKLVPKWHPLGVVSVGAVVLGILEMLPWVGFFFLLAAFWYGTGALLLNLKRAYQRPNYAAK